MNILSQLSSQVGDITETANQKVAAKCLKQPALLKDIAKGLIDANQKLIGDTAEIMTIVAEQKPELIKPFAQQIIPLLDHKYTRARWEAAHSLSYLATYVPKEIGAILPKLKGIAILDDSTIVRDYTTWTIANYAQTSKTAAHAAVDALAIILDQWKDKQAAKVIQGFIYAVKQDKTLLPKVQKLVKPYEKSTKGVVKKVVKQFQTVIKK
ncbi:MAG: hypothetical protein WCW27_03865 [Patescibacteria group bacterium]|jgi:hypothetical protein